MPTGCAGGVARQQVHPNSFHSGSMPKKNQNKPTEAPSFHNNFGVPRNNRDLRAQLLTNHKLTEETGQVLEAWLQGIQLQWTPLECQIVAEPTRRGWQHHVHQLLETYEKISSCAFVRNQLRASDLDCLWMLSGALRLDVFPLGYFKASKQRGLHAYRAHSLSMLWWLGLTLLWKTGSHKQQLCVAKRSKLLGPSASWILGRGEEFAYVGSKEWCLRKCFGLSKHGQNLRHLSTH